MSPTPRTAALAAALAAGLLVVPWPFVALAAVVLAVAVVLDARDARRPVTVRRTCPSRLARGVGAPLVVTVGDDGAGRRVVVRQPRVPDVAVEPATAAGGLDAVVVARRRGRHVLPPVAVRTTGALGLARWDGEAGGPVEVEVLPDLPAARALATRVRQGRFRHPGLRRRGPVGLGTDFDRLRDYLPDDDVRHVNWVATACRGRPMTNQYREDTDRDVVAVVDCGRLMAAPVATGPGQPPDRTGLDVAVDVAVALAAVADVLGDRGGVVAFDDGIRARVAPRRASGDAVVRAVHALEPRGVDSVPDVAFRAIGTTKRALVVVLTDLVDEAAAASLLEALPTLVRRHAVVVASCTDADLEADAARAAADPTDPVGLVAGDVLAARDRAAARLRHGGARVVQAPPAALAAAVVAAYLDAKAFARL